MELWQRDVRLPNSNKTMHVHAMEQGDNNTLWFVDMRLALLPSLLHHCMVLLYRIVVMLYCLVAMLYCLVTLPPSLTLSTGSGLAQPFSSLTKRHYPCSTASPNPSLR
jgi:hypothetical protein